MEKIWFKDIKNFINAKNYDVFFPSSSMTYTKKLNSILRLSIYFSIIVLIIKKDSNILFIPALTAVFTFFLYNNDDSKTKNEEEFLAKMNLYKDTRTKEICYKPEPNNPFMNILMSDYTENPKRPKACNITNGHISKMAKTFFEKNLYRDVGDIFQKNASDRNYITQPVSEIPNNQEAFLKFSYDIGPTCKEGSGDTCYKNSYRNILR